MTPTTDRTRRLPILAGALAILAVVAAACGGGAGKSSSAGLAPGRPAASPAGVPSEGGSGGDEGTGVLAGIPQVLPNVVKTARVSVEVPRGEFQSSLDKATEIAADHGGYVESSSIAGRNSGSGRMVIRVPQLNFEAALADVSALGDVQAHQVSSEDVTGRVVDLDARLRNARAQEEVLLGILKSATTVRDTLRVQQTLSNVQLQIEELVGQQRSLQDRVALGTIDLSLVEAGRPVHVQAESGNIANPSLAEAWDRSKATFFGLLYGIVVSLAVIVPLGLLALAAWLVVRRVRARDRGAASGPERPDHAGAAV
ncbi:MAG TPA: DUF4349 domain-containing protein [Actinomycetota bacterium]